MLRHRIGHHRLSSKLVSHLLEGKGLTQDQLAMVLECHPSFVSRVRSRERDFSPEQMRVIADHLGVPLGAMLIDAIRPSGKLPPDRQKLVELCQQVIRKADAAHATLRADREAKRKGEPKRSA